MCIKKPTDHNALVRGLNQKIKKGFHLNYTSKNVSIFIHDYNEWRELKDDLDLANVPYFSYTPKAEKEHAFVIRGLDNQPTVEDLKETLKSDYNLAVSKCFKLSTPGRPLYMITTSSDYTVKKLNNDIKYINHTKICWERRSPSTRQIIQCHRCQAWGHATSNCKMPPKCLKCALSHLTHQCIKKPDTPAKCANCGKDHPANFTGCEIYLKELEGMSKNNEKKEFVPAPAPTFNPWAARGRQSHFYFFKNSVVYVGDNFLSHVSAAR